MKSFYSFFLCCFFFIVVRGQNDPEYKKMIDSLISSGQTAKAISFLDGELKKKSDNDVVLKWLGYAHAMNKTYNEAEKYYNQALALNPGCRVCLENIGKIYVEKSDYKTALSYLNRAIDIEPKKADLFSTRGEIKEAMGDKMGALMDYTNAINLDPENYIGYLQRADFNFRRGFVSQAGDDFNNAVAMAPNDFTTYYNRAVFYFRSEKYAEALTDVEKAITLNKSNGKLFMLRGVLLQATNKLPLAIEEYNKAIALNVDDYNVYINRASCYYALEDMDKYCSDYAILNGYVHKNLIKDDELIRRIKDENENFCNAGKAVYYYQRGIAKYNLKDYRKALQFYNEGLKKFPNHSMMLSFKGNAYLALAEYREAIDCYNRSLENKSKLSAEMGEKMASPEYISALLSDIYSSMGECKMNLAKYDDALADATTAISISPDIMGGERASYYNLRGYIQLLKGNGEASLKDFDKSISLQNDHPAVYVNRAIAKVSKAEKVQHKSIVVRAGVSSQSLNNEWVLPLRLSSTNNQSMITAALNDCNKAIDLDKSFAFAYYIRGQIKYLLNHDDYCLDINFAEKNGIEINAEMMKNCK